MNTTNYFSRVLGAFLLCVGMVLTSCEETNPIDDNKTEQGGNENNGNETPEPEPLVTASVQNITYKDVEVTGKLNVSASDLPFCQVVVYYSNEESFNVNAAEKVSVTTFDNDQKFTVTLSDLSEDTEYNFCLYVKTKSEEFYTDINSFTTSLHQYSIQANINMPSATDLSENGTANCYVISESGTYKFKTVKGNSSTVVGDVASCSILWETFGTNITPELNELIAAICYKDGYIAFETGSVFKEGNAVIAARDANRNVLWSWHIWLTDQPAEHVYYNNAGTMMDRNLGATSATPGDVGALGLLYQWGRKDPFLGFSSVHKDSQREIAVSTITWPDPATIDPWEPAETDAIYGTIEYSIANPTTFIRRNCAINASNDWYYTANPTDNTRWTTHEFNKSIYDPCPVGWRIPDGGENGVWAKALSKTYIPSGYDESNNGYNQTSKLGDDKIWFPGTSYRQYHGMNNPDWVTYSDARIWSATPCGDHAYCFYLFDESSSTINPNSYGGRGYGYSVRCVKE